MGQKWPIAVYYDSGSVRHQLDRKSLDDAAPNPAERLRIRNLELWDSAEEYRLAPRFRSNAAHFYSPQSNTRSVCSRAEKSTGHNRCCATVIGELERREWTVGYYAWDKMSPDDPNGEKVIDPLFRTGGYSWGKEVTRTLTSGIRWVHDVFGAKLDLRTSERFPWFAVEVIDTHFPDQQALDGWIEASKSFPYVVAFEFVASPKYFFAFNEKLGCLRISYYIYDGRLWNGASPWTTTSAAFFKERLKDVIKQSTNCQSRH
jgi:hypothetical protein